jgi:purine-cytosine permease-like protein
LLREQKRIGSDFISGSGEIERHGIESIPDKDRTATIFDFMRIEWGGSNSLATAVLGAALVALANPMSFGAFLGDWSRYLPRDTDRWRLMGGPTS